MSEPLFVSYAQNGEDVILWRALRGVVGGRYLDVGAYDPDEHSVTKAFYDRGWRGVNVEPFPGAAARFREARPRDETVEAVVTAEAGGTLTFHYFPGTGLSTLVDDIAERHQADGYDREDIQVRTTTLDELIASSGLLDPDIHFLKIDVEGAEADVIASIDLDRHRPWVIVVEATEPTSTTPSHEKWEPTLLSAEYDFCLFDGLSRYYVAAEHQELKPALSYPVCVFDEFTTVGNLTARDEVARLAAESARLWDDVVHWRNTALHAWSDGFGKIASTEGRRLRLRARLKQRNQELRDIRAEVDWMRSSLSWRVTKPLRWIRSRKSARRASPKVAAQ